MIELPNPVLEQADIVPPQMHAGDTVIGVQRHAEYDRNRDSVLAGSLMPRSTEQTYHNDEAFFGDVLDQEINNPDGKTKFLFVSSDTRYGQGGYRSMETAEVAQVAAVQAMLVRGIDPAERIINFDDAVATATFPATGQYVVPEPRLREPSLFENPGYLKALQDEYGTADGKGRGLHWTAFAAHEADAMADIRREHGAEGIQDIVDRTDSALHDLQQYAREFHDANPDSKLVIWVATHYDTISPMYKVATDMHTDVEQKVDYSGGFLLEIAADSDEVTLATRSARIRLPLGQNALRAMTAETHPIERPN